CGCGRDRSGVYHDLRTVRIHGQCQSTASPARSLGTGHPVWACWRLSDSEGANVDSKTLHLAAKVAGCPPVVTGWPTTLSVPTVESKENIEIEFAPWFAVYTKSLVPPVSVMVVLPARTATQTGFTPVEMVA